MLTVRNVVKLAALDNKWQQKKNDPVQADRNKELTAEEKDLQFWQQQADDIRENKKYETIDAKLKSGEPLTKDEIDYLKKNNPQALKEYEEIKQEKESYKKQLKNCKTKDDVEELKMTKLSGFMAQAKEISTNPYIPKAQKRALLEKLLKKTNTVQEEHLKFIQSLQYQELPEDREELEEDKKACEAVEEGSEADNPGQGDINPEAETDTATEIQRLINSEMHIDIKVTQNTQTSGTAAGTDKQEAGFDSLV